MNRTGADIETSEPVSPSYWATLTSWRLIPLSAVFISVLVIPAGLTYYFAHLGPPETSYELYTIGIIAMLPGFLMGGAGLLVAAIN